MGGLDFLVVAAYALAVLLLGGVVSRRHQSTQDLWLGGRRLPTWAVLLSMVATELSAATFIGVPEAAYRSNWSYLQLAFGALLGKLALALFVIPLYHRLEVITVYGLLERRFGPESRRRAALCFIFGRILASGVRLFIAALAFSVVTGVAIEWAIAVCGVVAGCYTLLGGIRSVIYTDVLQGAVFLAAALALLGTLAGRVEGFGAFMDWAAHGERLRVFTLTPLLSLTDSQPLLVGVIGGFFLTLATHGTDHDMVQRLLTTRDGRSGGRALLGSALLNFPLTLLFLAVGTGIAYAYQTPPAYAVGASSEVLPLFVLHELPAGLRGLFFAGLLAAAMSSFDSAICAISTTWVVDVREHRADDDAARSATRWASVSSCVLLLVAALGMSAYHRALTVGGEGPELGLVELALSAMTILYGGLLGVFALAVLSRRRGSDRSVSWGLGVGALVGAMLFVHPVLLGEVWIAWPWWIPLSATMAFAVAALRATPRYST